MATMGILIMMLILLLHVFPPTTTVHSTASNAPSPRQPPSRIVVHVHLYQEGNFVILINKTSTQTRAPPSGQIFSSAASRFRSIDLPMTSVIPTTKDAGMVVGAARGLSHETLPPADNASAEFVPPSKEQLFEVLEYDDGEFAGTLALHGQMSFPPHPDDEVAIVGGTRSFRCVQGFAFPSLVQKVDTFVLFQWDIRLFYPTLCTSSTAA